MAVCWAHEHAFLSVFPIDPAQIAVSLDYPMRTACFREHDVVEQFLSDFAQAQDAQLWGGS